MRIICCDFLVVLLLLVSTARAAPIANLAHYYIAKGATQTAVLSVADSDNAAAEDIEGMTFALQIANGTGCTPSISSIDFLTNSIWTGHVAPDFITNPNTGNDPQFKLFSLTTNNAGEFVNANGTLVTLGFNTAGATPGDYPLKLIGTKDPGSDSLFISGVGSPVSAMFGNGTLTVVAAGDFTRDNHVNTADISAMMTALTDLNVYKTSTGLNDAGLVAVGDLNGDHLVTNADLQSLLTLLKNGGGSIAAVPEPASLGLAALACGISVLVLGRKSGGLKCLAVSPPSAAHRKTCNAEGRLHDTRGLWNRD